MDLILLEIVHLICNWTRKHQCYNRLESVRIEKFNNNDKLISEGFVDEHDIKTIMSTQATCDKTNY